MALRMWLTWFRFRLMGLSPVSMKNIQQGLKAQRSLNGISFIEDGNKIFIRPCWKHLRDDFRK